MGAILSTHEQPKVHQEIIYDNTITTYHMRQLDEYRRHNDELIQENKLLKLTLEQMRKEQASYDTPKTYSVKECHKDTTEHNIGNAGHLFRKAVDKQKVEEFVEKMLQDPDVKIFGVPEILERSIYRNVFTIVLSMLDYLLETTDIQLLGHKIVFDLEPDNNPPDNTPENTDASDTKSV